MLMPPRVSRQSEGSRIALFLRKLEGCARTDDVARRRNEGRAQEIARGHGEGHCDGDRLARLRHRDAARIGRNTRDPGQAAVDRADRDAAPVVRSEEHTSELQSLMRISYAVFCLQKKKKKTNLNTHT